MHAYLRLPNTDFVLCLAASHSPRSLHQKERRSNGKTETKATEQERVKATKCKNLPGLWLMLFAD